MGTETFATAVTLQLDAEQATKINGLLGLPPDDEAYPDSRFETARDRTEERESAQLPPAPPTAEQGRARTAPT